MKSVVSVTILTLMLSIYTPTRLHAASEAERLVASLCDYAKGNDRSLMRKKLKQAHLKLRRIYGGVKCGPREGFSGGSLLRLATFFNAFKSAKYITQLIGAAAVTKPEKDGQTILQWTQALAASDASKAADLKQFIDLYASK